MVIVLCDGKREEVKGEFSDVAGLLKHLSINSTTVLVRMAGEIVTLDEKVGNKDEIEILRITSKG